MTGVSYMLPFVVAGGILIALGFAVGGATEVTEVEDWPVLGDVFTSKLLLGVLLFKISVLAFSMLVPILAGYIAFGMIDRPGIAPGVVAGLIAVELDAGNFTVMAAVMIAGMTPPLGLALATALRPRRFTEAEQESGKAAWLLGASFITEGAIPFAAADPLRVIPSLMLGSATAGAISMAVDAQLRAPHGGIFVVGLIDGKLGYLLAAVAGTVVTAAAVHDRQRPVGALGAHLGLPPRRRGHDHGRG